MESALAYLEHLQNQIDRLRSAIPDLVRPLYTAGVAPHTKAEVLLEVRKVAVQKNRELGVFVEEWRGNEAVKVLERAKATEAEDGNLGRCGEVPRWGWGERVEGRGESGRVNETS